LWGGKWENKLTKLYDGLNTKRKRYRTVYVLLTCSD
jgi:hypothetical protein